MEINSAKMRQIATKSDFQALPSLTEESGSGTVATLLKAVLKVTFFYFLIGWSQILNEVFRFSKPVFSCIVKLNISEVVQKADRAPLLLFRSF